MKPKEFVIDRKKWYRGRGSANSALLRSDGTMCCMGFYAKACGFEDREILDAGTHPFSATIESPYFIDGRFGQAGLFDVNDNVTLSEEDRETILTRLFADNGIAVRFEG